MSTSYIRLPLSGGVPSYANLAAFPAASTAGNGALAVALDTDILYISTGSIWESIGGGTVPLSVGTIDSQPASDNGAVFAVNTLVMQSANATKPGLVNLTTQSFAGNKTFTGSITASNLSGTNTGDVTLGTANGLSLSGQALSLVAASTSTTGALTSADWNTFNGKQAAGNYITALTGDGTASGPGSAALTLATVNTNVGSFGDASHVTSFTVNGKGLITAASSTSIQIAESQVTNLVSDLAGKQAVGNYITALTGDITASGPGSAAATLATVNSNVGSFTNASITVNGKGLITAASSGAAPVTTLAAVGASPNTNAATISGNTLNLQPFDATHPGVVPASGGGTTTFLRADGSFAEPSSSIGTPTDVTLAFTSLGTVANQKTTYMQIGKRIVIDGVVQTGTVAASGAYITLPVNIDTTFYTAGSNIAKLGSGTIMTSTTNVLYATGGTVFDIYYDGSTNNKGFIGYRTSSGTYEGANASSFIGNTTYLNFHIEYFTV